MKFFHRYNSTIHGNYRKAYLRCGLITGGLLALYIMVRYLMGSPAESPEAYMSDIIMLLAVFLFTLLYRNSLEEKKATLKELMLFGLGTAVVASLLYGVCLWLFGYAVPEQTDLFTRTLRGEEAVLSAPSHYWAAWWGIESAIKLAVLGGFGAFVASLLFKNEKSDVHSKKENV
jgi:uncharacterized membrane protein (GlpM family)